MKKILLLGGSRYLLPVIEAAHKLGLYVITCDYLPDNIAHGYSEEYCNVSIADKEAVLAAAKTLRIDGIMSFACDPGVVTAAYVAEKLNLPSVGPYESVKILQDKGEFRKFLSDNGFTVPMAKSFRTKTEALKCIDSFHLPVVVKPVDSAGSKGVTRIESISQMEKSIEYALSFSVSNRFIIEDFIEKKGFSSDSDSFSVDGELKFVSFSSQRFDETAANQYTPAAFSWPASISQEHQNELRSEIQRLLKLLKMKTSIYNIESREGIDGKAYIMEVSPRGGGNRLAEILRYATGVDLITNAVKAAVGEPITEIKQKSCDGFWSEIILHGNRSGIFKELWVSADVKNNIIETDLWIERGGKVKPFDAANAAIGTLILRFENEKEMSEKMNNIKEWLKVITE